MERGRHELTFKLSSGVKWHDGKPLTARDVQCTWDLILDKGPEKLRLNPRKTAYDNLAAVTTHGDDEVTFQLKRPQPAFPMLLAGGFSVIYPCHVSAAEMRQHPIGSGPFKFVEFKPNEHIKVTATRTTGNPVGRISTASNIPSSATHRRRHWPLSPASLT